jgi:hypothetical protein
MQVTCSTERSLLDHDEFEAVQLSHHPAVYGLSRDELLDLVARLRKLRDQERTFARQRRREARGKAASRGGGFPGTGDRARARDQIFTAAVRRLDKELRRQRTVAARTAHAEAARRALALRRAAEFVHHPGGDATALTGLTAIPSRRRRHRLAPSRVGRASQHNKVRQAVRDARNG